MCFGRVWSPTLGQRKSPLSEKQTLRRTREEKHLSPHRAASPAPPPPLQPAEPSPPAAAARARALPRALPWPRPRARAPGAEPSAGCSS